MLFTNPNFYHQANLHTMNYPGKQTLKINLNVSFVVIKGFHLEILKLINTSVAYEKGKQSPSVGLSE